MKVAVVYMNDSCNIGWGAAYIASSIINEGHDLTFFDTYWDSTEKISKKIVKNNYDFVLISTMTMLFSQSLKLINLIKNKKNIPIMVGGIHPTIIGEELLRKHKEIDYLCIGEGESMIVEFLKNFENTDFSKIKNLVYRKKGNTITNELRKAEDLSKIPSIRWNLFKKEAILQDNGFIYVNATRGCPYNCTYCCNGIYLNKYKRDYLRFRPVNHVVKELEYLDKKYSPKLFYFGDEMILSNKKYAIKLFSEIKKKINKPVGCMVRVENLNKDIANLLAKNGCRYIAMGVECGDEEFRKKHLNRHMSNDQIISAFRAAEQAGIFTTSFNMIGYPFKNDKELTKKTVELNKVLRPDYVQVSIFYPFPGTKLYDYCVENKLIDKNKIKNVSNYYSDSVLKGVTLAYEKNKLHREFNPKGFTYSTGQNYMEKKIIRLKSFIRWGRIYLKKTLLD